MSNLVRSKYDANTVLGFVLDEERGALITVPHENQEFAIELSHQDGDSVLSVLPTIELQGNQEKPCIGIKNVVLYVVKGIAKVEVSPLSEGDLFFELNLLHMIPKDICAKRIRLTVDENSEAYICGQG